MHEDWLEICKSHLNKADSVGIHGRSGVLACCTVHDDSNPSLHIWIDDDRWPQCKCYAGCERVRIMEDLASRGLWPPNHPALIQLRRSRGEELYAAGIKPERVGALPDRPKTKEIKERWPLALVRGGNPISHYPFKLKPGRQLSKHGPWIYYAAQAEQAALVLFRIDTLVERDGETKRGKIFMQFTPRRKSDGKIQWRAMSYGHEDVEAAGPLQPYGYERIDDDPEKPIFIVEGEKAADALRSIDPSVIALTFLASGVDQDKGTTIHTLDALGGMNRRIIVWPDPDEAGQIKADFVIRLLERLPRVWVARINPKDLGLKNKEDAYEWVYQGIRKTYSDLISIAEKLTYRYAASWEDVSTVINRGRKPKDNS